VWGPTLYTVRNLIKCELLSLWEIQRLKKRGFRDSEIEKERIQRLKKRGFRDSEIEKERTERGSNSQLLLLSFSDIQINESKFLSLDKRIHCLQKIQNHSKIQNQSKT
jgi:hypothetical protein